MKWKEQLRKDKQTLAGLAPRQKMLFIWDYYKLPILSLLLVAVLAGAGAAAAARSAHTAFYAVMVNANMKYRQTRLLRCWSRAVWT